MAYIIKVDQTGFHFTARLRMALGGMPITMELNNTTYTRLFFPFIPQDLLHEMYGL